MVEFNVPVSIVKDYSDEERWYVEGFGATSDIDREADIISDEALHNAAQGFLRNSTVLFNHDADRPIGKVVGAEYQPQARAVWFKIMISKNERELWEKIKEGIVNKFSIHAKIPNGGAHREVLDGESVRIVTAIDPIEISVVSVPGNERAEHLAWYVSKSLDVLEEKGEIESSHVQKDDLITDLIQTIEKSIADFSDEKGGDSEVSKQLETKLDELKGLLKQEHELAGEETGEEEAEEEADTTVEEADEGEEEVEKSEGEEEEAEEEAEEDADDDTEEEEAEEESEEEESEEEVEKSDDEAEEEAEEETEAEEEAEEESEEDEEDAKSEDEVEKSYSEAELQAAIAEMKAEIRAELQEEFKKELKKGLKKADRDSLRKGMSPEKNDDTADKLEKGLKDIEDPREQLKYLLRQEHGGE